MGSQAQPITLQAAQQTNGGITTERRAVWWCRPVIPTPGQSRQENQKFKVIPSYIANLRPDSPPPTSPQDLGHWHFWESLSRNILASLKLLVSHPLK